MAPEKQLTLLLYSEDQKLLETVQKVFKGHKVHALNMMLSAFDFIKDNHVDALLFDTFQIEPFSGINENDLDVLLYYASSEDSQNKNMVFLPIDSEVEGKNKAVDLYSSLFDKYIFLLSPVTAETLEPDSIKPSEPMQQLSSIISTLDLALDGLDKKITISKTEHIKEESTLVKDNSSYFQGDDATTVSGFSEQEDEEATTVSGSQEEGEEAITVSGDYDQEDEEAIKISGSRAEKEGAIRVSGAPEEEDQFSQTIKGSKEDLAEEKIKISGSREEIKDEVTRIKGASASDEEVSSFEEKDINMRNNKGMTPVMVLARMGQIEKVKNLLKIGADPKLFSHQGKTLLHYACRGTNDVEFISDLVEIYDLKTNKRDSKGRDPLYDAIEGDNDQIIDYLVHHGARLEVKYDGEGILHVALKRNAYKCFRQLLIEGANIMSKNSKGEDIITYCKKKKNLKALKIIAEVTKAKKESVA